MVRLLWILLALLQLPHYRLLHHQSEFIPPHSVLTPQILKTRVKIGNYFALKKSANLNPFANLNHRSQLNLLSFLIARNETSLKGASNDLSSIGFIQLSPSLINWSCFRHCQHCWIIFHLRAGLILFVWWLLVPFMFWRVSVFGLLVMSVHWLKGLMKNYVVFWPLKLFMICLGLVLLLFRLERAFMNRQRWYFYGT